MSMAERLREIAGALKVPLIFKASYDKANRSSVSSFRGPGLKEGLRILAKIKKSTGLPILTDVHDVSHVGTGRGGLRRAADSRVPFAPDGPAGGRRASRAAWRISRRASSFRRGTSRTPPRRSRARGTRRSFSPSAARRLAIRTSWWTCGRFRSCASWDIRWSST